MVPFWGRCTTHFTSILAGIGMFTGTIWLLTHGRITFTALKMGTSVPRSGGEHGAVPVASTGGRPLPGRIQRHGRKWRGEGCKEGEGGTRQPQTARDPLFAAFLFIEAPSCGGNIQNMWDPLNLFQSSRLTSALTSGRGTWPAHSCFMRISPHAVSQAL